MRSNMGRIGDHVIHRPVAVFLFFAVMLLGFWLWGKRTGKMPMKDGRVIDPKNNPIEFGCTMAVLFYGTILCLAVVALLLLIP